MNVRFPTMLALGLAACASGLTIGSCYLAHAPPEMACAADEPDLGLPFSGGALLVASAGGGYAFEAGFGEVPWESSHGAGNSCHVAAQEGACTARVCDSIGAPAVDPGTIVARVNDRMLATISLERTGLIALDPRVTPFAPGDIVDISSDGATVPAFDACLVAPPVPLTTVPELRVGVESTVTWGPTTAVAMLVEISSSRPNGPRIECRAPGSAGQITIAPSITSMLMHGETLVVLVGATNARTVAAGQYEVHVMAMSAVGGNPRAI